jgi:hypothetical protein
MRSISFCFTETCKLKGSSLQEGQARLFRKYPMLRSLLQIFKASSEYQVIICHHHQRIVQLDRTYSLEIDIGCHSCVKRTLYPCLIVGPSATGFEKGNPSSIISAPPRTSASTYLFVASGVGSPAQI